MIALKGKADTKALGVLSDLHLALIALDTIGRMEAKR